MEYSDKEKADAVRGYMKEIMTLADRLANTDKIMNVMTLEERSKVFAGIFDTTKEMSNVINRLEGK